MNTPPNHPKSPTRRTFLAASAATAPMILSSGVLGAPGKPGANSRLNIGIIGVGGKGKNHLRKIGDHVGALCDVDSIHLEQSLKLLKRDVPVYSDYRKLLERKDIDGVLIGAPDHWHALMTIHACEAGKDVYVEKPASRYIREGRAMVKAAEANKSVVVVGSQGRCHPGGAVLREFIQSGAIGDIKRVECWHNDNHVGGDPSKKGTPPANLDWDMWLGPLPMRAYNPDYCHRNFRWMIELGGGQIVDRGAHVFNLITWILGLERTGPSRVSAKGNVPTEGLWTCPLNFEVTYQFSDPKLSIHWAQPGVRGGDFEFGAVYYGTKGKTVVLGGDGRVFPDQQVIDFANAKGMPYALKKGEFADLTNLQNWMSCMKSREQPIMDVESGHRVASMCSLANVSWQLGRPIRWDPEREVIKGDRSANLLLGGPGRGEFRIG